MPRQRAVGPEQMILPDDLGELAAAAAGRPADAARRAPAPPRRTGSVRSAPGARRSHPPQLDADICWPPRTMVMRQSRLCCAGDALEIAGLGDLRIVDREHDVAALEAERCAGEPSATSTTTTPRSRDRAAVHRPAPARGWRPWRPGTASGAVMTTPRAAVSGAASSATAQRHAPCRRACTPSWALPPSGLVAKR